MSFENRPDETGKRFIHADFIIEARDRGLITGITDNGVTPSTEGDQAQIGVLLDMDVFTPPRQDWLDKTDAYLRGK